ncbi:MAG: hypothetical protein HY909_05810 [Deltaproteobacteria bacterium]|nr:hypothetical protein [Deltaproteobacteria bacterium]
MSIRSRYGVLIVGLALAAAVPREAQAQAPRDRATRGMISQAMESYQALEIEDATNRLQLALRGCNNGNCSPQVTARVYMSLGIVAVMGQQDTAAGVNFMVQALREDPNAEPDQLVVTPEITTAFNDARRRAAGGDTGQNPPPRNNPRNPPPPPPPSTDGGALLHTPPSEQLDNTALPVYVETSGISPEHVYLYFKGNGMVQFRRLEMRRMAAGYGVEVPCGQVIQPAIEYYVTALDANQNTVGSVGSENSPVRVSIVTRRTQPAPSLPGAMPPQRCTESECPPGMTGPQCSSGGNEPRGNGGPGDPCTSDNACGSGLHCSEGSCVFGEAPDRSGGGGGGGGAGGRAPRFSIDVGGGLGAAFLSGRPSYAEARFAVDPATMMRTGAIVCTPYVC